MDHLDLLPPVIVADNETSYVTSLFVLFWLFLERILSWRDLISQM